MPRARPWSAGPVGHAFSSSSMMRMEELRAAAAAPKPSIQEPQRPAVSAHASVWKSQNTRSPSEAVASRQASSAARRAVPTCTSSPQTL